MRRKYNFTKTDFESLIQRPISIEVAWPSMIEIMARILESEHGPAEDSNKEVNEIWLDNFRDEVMKRLGFRP